MSRIGIQPITIEDGVEVKIAGNTVTVTGPKGEMVVNLSENVSVETVDEKLVVSRKDETKQAKSDHGTFRMLIVNAIKGVKDGYEKTLEMVGVGYRAKLEGTTLVLSLGWNHPIKYDAPENITVEVPDETKIIIKGFNKQQVGEVAAKIRDFRKPEPYKGKGVRYEGEKVRRKSAKSSLVAE